MDLYFSIVTDEPQFAEFVQEKAHARTGRADHLCQRFLTDIYINRLRASFLSEMREQKKKTREPLLARIKQHRSRSP
jgi:hypothetical protein